MAMNEILAKFYNTAGEKTASALSDEELQEQASVDMFCKVAADQSIDLTVLPDEQVQELYGVFLKAAAEEPAEKSEEDKKKEEEEEKHAAALAEFNTKKEAADKIAEADYIGRVIAHSLVHELGEIEKVAGGADAAAVGKASALARNSHFLRAIGKARQAGEKAVEVAGEGLEHTKKHLENVGHKLTGAHGGLGRVAPETARRVGGAAYGGGAAVAAGGAAAVHHAIKKHGSAFDALAGEQAVAMAGEQGWDIDQASRKVAAVLELGLGESEKVASAADYETSLGIRGLELLDAAGYPVSWTE